tara:strand:+ start:760 stop:1272 length:513 start_codon:yes stop_codon:yes gene_type:complete
MVIWFTGLSGSGKTTLSIEIKNFLINRKKTVKVIDGDTIRDNSNEKLDFSTQGIIYNNKRIINMCLKLIKQYDYIIVSVIAPFNETRMEARKKIGSLFIEVFVKANLETLIERDTKGLYKRALKGQIDNFIGIDKNTPYETPMNPDIIINTNKETIEQSTQKLIGYLKID